jgi:hypothetical protein
LALQRPPVAVVVDFLAAQQLPSNSLSQPAEDSLAAHLQPNSLNRQAPAFLALQLQQAPSLLLQVVGSSDSHRQNLQEVCCK